MKSIISTHSPAGFGAEAVGAGVGVATTFGAGAGATFVAGAGATLTH